VCDKERIISKMNDIHVSSQIVADAKEMVLAIISESYNWHYYYHFFEFIIIFFNKKLF
jgi:hypothetical protein